MKIEPIPAFAVTSDEGTELLRLGENSWWELCSNSYEQVMDADGFERAYKEEIRKAGGYA